MWTQVLLYSGLGVLQDLVITRYYLALTSRRVFLAPVLAVLITVLAVAVLDGLITSHHPILILSYGLGTGLGTRLGMGRCTRPAKGVRNDADA